MEPSLEARLSAVADRDEIRDLAARYAHCVWQADIDGMVALFTRDGEMDPEIYPVVSGHEALVGAFKSMLEGREFQPFVHNHVIELAGDEATGTVYVDLRYVEDGRSMIGSAYYEDRYVRTHEGWRFRARRLRSRFLAPLLEGWAESRD